jgi:processive 1,2-diacylglycerol beta-glucosyltransferase
MPHILIVTADIGAGHDLPAELLAGALRERGCEVTVADGMTEMGPVALALGRQGVETILRRFPWIFDAEYRLFQRGAPAAGWMLEHVGGRGLRRLIARVRPDVVVSTYPGTTEAIGRLRPGVPTVAAVTDLAALNFWVHPGIDRHLIIHDESRAEVTARGGRDIHHVRGFSRPQFDAPPSRADARAALGLPGGSLVAISGGGWGVGDLELAARVVVAAGATPICLCGTNDELRSRLSRLGYRTEGFTTRIAEWIAAADVLVHSTAGLTIREAELCGTWAISFGWGYGHIRVNNAAYRHFGLAAVATSEAELRAELARALAAPRARVEQPRETAADAVLALVQGAGGGGSTGR